MGCNMQSIYTSYDMSCIHALARPFAQINCSWFIWLYLLSTDIWALPNDNCSVSADTYAVHSLYAGDLK